jgi:hypothetical protein
LRRRTSRRISTLAAPPPRRRHAIQRSAWKGYSPEFNFALTEF